jgi:putative sterol carrier protein
VTEAAAQTEAKSPIPFATQPWLDQFRQTLNDSSTFRKSASSWNDDSLFVIDVDQACGWSKPVAFYMKWKDGEIVEAKLVEDTTQTAVFRVTGIYSAWAQVYHSKMEAGIAFLTGKFKFRGPFAKAARNIAGEVIMLRTAYQIPTRFLPAHRA